MMAAEFLVAESMELKILTWLESQELLINNQCRESFKSLIILLSHLFNQSSFKFLMWQKYITHPQSKFPWGHLQKQNPISWKDSLNTCSKYSAIFQHIHLWNWDICHTVGPTLISLCHRSLPRIGTIVWHSSPPLCHSENANAGRIGISCGVIKDGK